MAIKNYFFYDERNCEFIPVEYNTLERIVYTACIWILCGVVLSGISISILSSTVGTPAEIALKAENQELLKQLYNTQDRIQDLDQELNKLAKVDNEMYRSVLGMDPIPYDERRAGVGGANIYTDFDVYNEETADILRRTMESLETIERGLNIQKVSFEQIKEYYNNNKKKMLHIPAIKPVKGVVLSGFGMRYHPILQYRRMHNGLDFRANIGDEVYSTGDGVIKFAARKGNLGRLIIVDHGYGYETRYAHLTSFANNIKSGTRVKRGDIIGYAGDSGLTEGPHLHYEIFKDSRAVDPLTFLFADTTPEEYLMFVETVENNDKSLD